MAKRNDSIGMFWEDEEKVRIAIEKIKRLPPERTWEAPDYLPGLQNALQFQPQQYTDAELVYASNIREPLLFDIEVYPNYVLFAFRGLWSRKCVYFEADNEPCGRTIHVNKLNWILQNFCIVNFNGRKYDFVIAALALAERSTEDMWLATEMIIVYQMRAQDVYKKFTARKVIVPNQIDLIELTALGPGLKVCAGRLHAKRMQDLPFVPGTNLTDEQQRIVFMYCFNDLDNTELLLNNLKEQIKVREDTGAKYNLDLRSHSDQQMAETIIAGEIKKLTGQRYLSRTVLPEDVYFKFLPAKFLAYQTPMMRRVLDAVCEAKFYVSETEGNIILPQELHLPVTIGNNTYKMGIGGLHSTEKSVSHVAGDEYFLADTDVTSYYPSLILNAGIAPTNLGPDFLRVYGNIVETRIRAKWAGDAILAECLKIVVNGTFGKLGSKYSIMYAPDLMMQVTLTGQLSLLMLIESLELAGIQVLSANTDGIATKTRRTDEAVFYSVIRKWEADTGFSTEEVRYKAMYNRDVNNYIAIYEKPTKGKLYKGKGAYAETSPKKNAVNEICVEAVIAMLIHNTPIMTTLLACDKLSKFTTMRHVNGGAVKDGVYLGKIIRWYYSKDAQGEIIYAKSGNRVPRTEGAKPCMDLPDEFPQDIDYEWYEREACAILEDIGHTQPTLELPT